MMTAQDFLSVVTETGLFAGLAFFVILFLVKREERAQKQLDELVQTFTKALTDRDRTLAERDERFTAAMDRRDERFSSALGALTERFTGEINRHREELTRLRISLGNRLAGENGE